MVMLIAGLVLFLGIHSARIFAAPTRDAFIAKRGEGAWKGLYTVVSLIGFVLIVWGWSAARAEAPVFWEPPVFVRHITAFLMLPALILLVASQLPAGRIKAAVKHPMLLSVKIWAFSHLLANGDLASLLLFGSFLAWGVLDRISVKKRGNPEFPSVQLRFDLIALVVGFGLYLAFVLWLHEWLFGVAPILA